MRDIFIKNQKLVKENYSHIQGKVFIINSGMAFKTIYKILSLFLPKSLKSKVQVLGKDYLPELLKEIEIENIPSSLGGQGVYEIG